MTRDDARRDLIIGSPLYASAFHKWMLEAMGEPHDPLTPEETGILASVVADGGQPVPAGLDPTIEL